MTATFESPRPADALVIATMTATFESPRPADALVEGSRLTKKALGEEYRQGTAALGESTEAEVLPGRRTRNCPRGSYMPTLALGGQRQRRRRRRLGERGVEGERPVGAATVERVLRRLVGRVGLGPSRAE
jgi:hypothetical protein